MKLHALLLPLFLFPISLAAQDRPTDVAEYGFKGKVRSVRTVSYRDVELKNGEWNLAESKITSIWLMIFNEDGNLTRIHEKYPTDSAGWYVTTTNIIFENGSKTGYTKTDTLGVTIETASYTWADPHHYELKAATNEGTSMVSHATLNESFRDVSGGYIYQNGDFVFLSESYTNTFDEKGEIVDSRYTDLLQERSYVIEYRHQKYDAKGNMIQIAQIEPESNTLVKLSIREFEYF